MRRTWMGLGLGLGLGLGACTPASSEGGGGESEATSGADCQPGTLDCACIEGECVPGLACVDALCVPASGDGDGDPTGDGDGDPTTGDGDGDPSGDGDGDLTGDGDGDLTGDGDGDPTGDGDGDGCATGTTEGCEFYSVKLAPVEYVATNNLPALIAVTNSGEREVEVVIERELGGRWLAVEGPTLLAPLETLESLRPSGTEIAYWGVDTGKALRIRSTGPVVAHQFNVGEGGPSPVGASTLLPTSAWDSSYRALTRGQGGFAGDYAQYAVVVAREHATTVEVELRQYGIAPGPGIPDGVGPGDSFAVELDAGQTLGLFGTDDNNGSVEGIGISSDPEHPIAVFVGQQGLNIGRNEDQLLGVNQWGTHYACPHIARPSFPSVEMEWRVMAASPTTFFDFEANFLPMFPMGPIQLFDPGDAEDYGQISAPHSITATKAVGVTPLMHYAFADGISTAALPSVDRWLSRYVIFVPAGSWTETGVTLVRPAGVAVTLDGVEVPLADQTAFPEGWEQLRFPIGEGAHELESSEPFLVIVNGWTISDDSYMYVAGAQL